MDQPLGELFQHGFVNIKGVELQPQILRRLALELLRHIEPGGGRICQQGDLVTFGEEPQGCFQRLTGFERQDAPPQLRPLGDTLCIGGGDGGMEDDRAGIDSIQILLQELFGLVSKADHRLVETALEVFQERIEFLLEILAPAGERIGVQVQMEKRVEELLIAHHLLDEGGSDVVVMQRGEVKGVNQ